MPSERRELRICWGRGRRRRGGGREERSEEESKFKSHVANLKSIRTTSEAEESRLFISKPVCQQSHLIRIRFRFRNHHYHQNAICHQRRLLLFAALAGLLACGPSIWANGQEEEQQQAEQPMPTVIVRGFLNYRTTVDGTVLLFTPDAGSQSPVETETSRIKPTPISVNPNGPRTPQNLRPVSANRINGQVIITDGAGIEPTPIGAGPKETKTAQNVRSMSADIKIRPTQVVDGGASSDEWRPVSALVTPTLAFDPAPADSTPSVQAANDDAEDANDNNDANDKVSTARSAKRPALGARARSFGGSASSSGSINGIRKPGLAQQQSSSTTSAPPTTSLNGQDSAASFQSRLASANTRMRNRLKHKQPLAASSSTSTPPPPTQPEVASHLDVASSSEQVISSPPRPAPDEHAHSAGGQLPVVGSDEVLTAAIASGEPLGRGHIAEVELESLGDSSKALQSRAGELRPGGRGGGGGGEPEEEPKVATGELQQGTLSSGPLNLEALFQSDQPIATGSVGGEPSESRPAVRTSSPAGSSGLTRPDGSALTKPPLKSHNEKLNGWLGAHHNKFVARPSVVAASQQKQSQLAANLNQLLPSFSSSLSSTSMPTSMSTPSLSSASSSAPVVVATIEASSSNTTTTTLVDSDIQAPTLATSVSMQTITRTYSTILETSKTRIVPLVVKSSTAVYTITEDYVMTKMMTAYQTMPAGEFVLPESTSGGGPFDMFAESRPEAVSAQSPPAVAPAGASSPVIETQEQPISLAEAKTGNNWLHDFTSPDSNDPFGGANQNQQQQQQSQVLALLEQQAREQNMPFGPGGETLEQLASQLDPAALLADGQINLPDLNNPLVLAAAIQNPQLAAVILAAQQLKLKRQQQLQANGGNQQLKSQLINLQQQQQAASYSTTFTTTIKPSTYTARDTMYTTRLVSFRDGRTVRTRTVSEPGSVVEQVITTIVTETIPITITIKPTGVLALPAQAVPATASPLSTLTGSPSNQATINNALFATQLAQLLARRQQQLQTSFQTPPSFMNFPSSTGGQFQQSAATPQQLLNLQQMFKQQQQQRLPAANTNQAQFQPNFAQLLQSLQSTGSAPATVSPQQQQQQQQQATPTLPSAPMNVVSSSTPVMMPAVVAGGGPISTTLTSLQVRTYTVHNAFKTIYRTITSTVLVPTVLPSG